jgi:uncharacterized membrane protein YbhN (UPF0104 family)
MNRTVFGKIVKTALPLIFGLAILWLVLSKLDIKEVLHNLKDANYWIIALSLPFGLMGQIFRALRWDLLIKPLGYNPKKSNLIYSVLGSYGVNLAFPRLGEVWRCTMINRCEKIPFTKLVGTMITDRIFDPVMVLLIFAAAFLMNMPYFTHFFAEHPELYDSVYRILSSPVFYAGIIVAVAVVWFAFTRFKNNFIIKKILDFLSGIWEGVCTVLKMKDKWLFVAYTFLIWFCYFLFFYICFYAFPFTENLGWKNGLIAFAIGSVAMAVPVQGGIGVWQLFVGFALMGFGGIDNNQAGAFTNCVWTIQSFLFTAAYGIFGIVALSLNNSKK